MRIAIVIAACFGEGANAPHLAGITPRATHDLTVPA
jgi:hypothetical protein